MHILTSRNKSDLTTNFHVKALKDLLFRSNQVTQCFSCQVFLLSSINLTLKIKLLSLLRGKYCLIHLEIKKLIITLKKKIMLPPTPKQHYLVELDFDAKFSQLRLLQFLINFKSSFYIIKYDLTLSNKISIQINLVKCVNYSFSSGLNFVVYIDLMKVFVIFNYTPQDKTIIKIIFSAFYSASYIWK